MGHIFGPVPSRRLGRSLGVDLVPFKTCSYDCVYCQLGRTTRKTVERREWAPLTTVVEQLWGKLDTRPDVITLSGSGEPTLYLPLGELIGRIRSMTDTPVAVLTNGSLLWREEVRRALMDAHLVIPSLDAGDERMFQAVNRPHESLTFERHSGVLLGGQVRGSASIGETINTIAACVQKRMTAEDIAMFQMGAHPALTASPIAYPLVNAAEVAISRMQ